MNKMQNVGFLADGSFLPVKNGGSYSIYGLMGALSRTRRVAPNLLLLYRGWDDPRLYQNQPFRTIFLNAIECYKNPKILSYALIFFNIKYIHLYNAEEIINFAPTLKKSRIKIIYEAINIDHVLYGRLGLPKTSTNRMLKLQGKASNLADHIFCRSDIDKKHMEQMGIKNKKISIYRGSIITDQIEFKNRYKKRYKIVFLGHMNYPPNEFALKIISKIIAPALAKKNSKYRITIVGDISDKIAKRYKKRNIIFKKGVINLDKELKRHDIGIAPLEAGSGTRLKILDYLASGLPVITTSLGIEGLHPLVRKCLFVEDVIKNYPDAIDNIMQSLEKYIKPAKVGRKFIEKYYTWKHNLEPFLSLYRK